MKKYIWVMAILLFACKKNNNTPRITYRQLPSKISIFSVDPATQAETLQYEMDLFYNENSGQFDSIILGGTSYKFDYSIFNSGHAILLNYLNGSLPYQEIIFDSSYYTLREYNDIQPTPASSTSRRLQYDGNRLTGYTTITDPVNDMSRAYTYKNDTSFIYKAHPYDHCYINDTIIDSYYDMSISLSWLLFADVELGCGSIPMMLRALPVSNYPSKLPLKLINGALQIDYTYTADTHSRLSEALLIAKIRDTGYISFKRKIRLEY
ncbi:MAG: hypothetical protein JWN78_378 [Bacteroidota bacterium]|nr:hypothetical protein [Bacteroidota bacterium]